MSFLKNNWHWMLFILIIFGGIGVVLFTQLNIDTEPETVYNRPSEEDIRKAQEANTPKRDVKPKTFDQPSQTGHRHPDGTWHEGEHGEALHPHSTTETETDIFPNLLERDSHWSDAYLPPMEELEAKYADDADAMFILGRVKTILKLGGLGAHGHNPAVDKAFVELMNFTDKIVSSLGTEVSPPRCFELLKLGWPLKDTPPPYVNWDKESAWLYEKKSSLRTEKGE